jgi:hypothetical protein
MTRTISLEGLNFVGERRIGSEKIHLQGRFPTIQTPNKLEGFLQY